MLRLRERPGTNLHNFPDTGEMQQLVTQQPMHVVFRFRLLKLKNLNRRKWLALSNALKTRHPTLEVICANPAPDFAEEGLPELHVRVKTSVPFISEHEIRNLGIMIAESLVGQHGPIHSHVTAVAEFSKPEIVMGIVYIGYFVK